MHEYEVDVLLPHKTVMNISKQPFEELYFEFILEDKMNCLLTLAYVHLAIIDTVHRTVALLEVFDFGNHCKLGAEGILSPRKPLHQEIL